MRTARFGFQRIRRRAALLQLVESSGFRTIRKASRVPGHYEINGDRRLLIRHSAAATGPWNFRFRRGDLAPLRDDRAAQRRVYLCLVCARETVCLLTSKQLQVTLDLAQEVDQWIRVYVRRNASIYVCGSAGTLDERIPNHAFPGRLFL